MEPSVEASLSETGGPTPEQVLGWIAASGGAAWFPSMFSKESGIARDSFDQPLNELRAAELVRVIDWVRGVGQGYALTPDGEAALNRPPEIAVAPEFEVHARAGWKPPSIDLRAPIATPALLLANLIWFFVGLVVATRLGVSLKVFLLEGDRTALLRLGAVSAPELLQGDWWRLASSCFVHGTIWHLLVNLFNLGMVGALAELLWGRWRVLLIYAIAGVAGSCLAMGLHPFDSSGRVPVTLLGASGALCGLAASVIAWILLFHRRLPPDLVSDLSRRLALGVVLSIAVSLLPGVSWEAHLGGAAAGFLVAVLLNAVRFRGGIRRALAVLVVAMMPALGIGGLLLAIRYAPVWAPLRRTAEPPANLAATPYLEALRPEAVRPVETEAFYLLATSPKNRKPERVAEVRTKVAAQWSNAVEASRLLTPSAYANPDKVRAFADARMQSLGQMLGLLDANAIPEVAAWKAWGERRREADSLWNEIVRK